MVINEYDHGELNTINWNIIPITIYNYGYISTYNWICISKWLANFL